MNLTLIIKDKYKHQTLSTKLYHIMAQMHRYSHKDSKMSSFSILWFFTISYEFPKIQPIFLKRKKINRIWQILCIQAPVRFWNPPSLDLEFLLCGSFASGTLRVKRNHVSVLFFFLHGESRDGTEGDTASSGPVSPAGCRQRRPRLRRASALALPPVPSRLLGSGRGGLD